MLAENLRYTLEEYYALPEGTHAELIGGVIYDMSPSPLRVHQRLVLKISYKIQQYIDSNKGKCEVYPAPFDVKLSDDTVVQPDISVICDPNKLTDRGCDGAPDWVIEITSSNAARDYITKLRLYQSYGVREYWIVDPNNKSVTVCFGKDFEAFHYDFTENIPVRIYDENLKINIDEMLK